MLLNLFNIVLLYKELNKNSSETSKSKISHLFTHLIYSYKELH